MSIPITPAMSLNRVRIVDLPDCPERIKGKTTWQLVASPALFDKLDTNGALTNHQRKTLFHKRLQNGDPVAESIAVEIGWNLGYVLLTLKRGDAVNRAARDEWTDNYWEHWRTVNNVWLGGGMAGGALGTYITEHAKAVLDEYGYADYRIRISPYANDLVLVGASRYVELSERPTLLFDFGGTFIKRGYTTQAVPMTKLPSIETPWETMDEARASQLIDDMVDIIVQTWQEMDETPSTIIPVSVAAYVKDGQPLLTQAGIYMYTAYATDNVQDEMGRRISKIVGQDVQVMLLHDGTTAAAAHAGERNAAVITIGTALGIGFPPA